MSNNKKPVVLSGIRPTGDLHLGNYFGAIKFFVELQKQNNKSLFFVADLHALTTALEDHIEVDEASIEVVRWYLACGVDPKKSLIYKQSDILEIPFFALLLGMITPVGELIRCTTYKDKVQGIEEKKKLVSLGLLAYPVLMAADILFCNADIVPVGKDQLQHLEIAREIARRYNHYFGKSHRFVEPQPYKLDAVNVPGLKGEGKMSKSVGGLDNVIFLGDSKEEIKRKIMAIPTDMGPVKGQEMTGTIKNLYELLKLIVPDDVYQKYVDKYQSGEQKFYGQLKSDLVDYTVKLLEPIQEKFNSPECSPDFIKSLLKENAEKVRPIAKKNLSNMLVDLKFKNLAESYK